MCFQVKLLSLASVAKYMQSFVKIVTWFFVLCVFHRALRSSGPGPVIESTTFKKQDNNLKRIYVCFFSLDSNNALVIFYLDRRSTEGKRFST